MFDNYSIIQKILHELCLSTSVIRRIFFEYEKRRFLQNCYIDHQNHIFICGLARSGTTALLESLYSSKNFGSLTYADMPFVLAPNTWSKIRKVKISPKLIERAHNDGIKIGLQSPEAFEEIFWQSFNDGNENLYFKEYIALILNKTKKNRYISKNNQNINRISKISKIFPKSIFLLTFRSPLDHASSLLEQHKRFCKLQSKKKFIKRYMDLTFHSEFGLGYKVKNKYNLDFNDPDSLNHWLEQWYKTYIVLLNDHKHCKNIFFVCFEKLCKKTEYWKEIQKLAQVNSLYQFKFPHKNKINLKMINEKLLKKCENLYNELIDIKMN